MGLFKEKYAKTLDFSLLGDVNESFAIILENYERHYFKNKEELEKAFGIVNGEFTDVRKAFQYDFFYKELDFYSAHQVAQKTKNEAYWLVKGKPLPNGEYTEYKWLSIKEIEKKYIDAMGIDKYNERVKNTLIGWEEERKNRNKENEINKDEINNEEIDNDEYERD